MGLNLYRKQARGQAISNNNSQAKHNSDQKTRKTVSTIMFAKVRPEFSVYLAIFYTINKIFKEFFKKCKILHYSSFKGLLYSLACPLKSQASWFVKTLIILLIIPSRLNLPTICTRCN